jgi:hypothetical protein
VADGMVDEGGGYTLCRKSVVPIFPRLPPPQPHAKEALMNPLRRFSTVALVALTLTTLVTPNAYAGIIHFQFVGDGVLLESGGQSSLGTTTMSFTYDTSDFVINQTFSFSPNATGSRWVMGTPVPISIVDASSQSYNVDPIVGASMYDQPSTFDQFNWEGANTNIIAQWNDNTSNAFGAVSSNFDAMNSQFLAALGTGSFLLANGNTQELTVLGLDSTQIRIDNAIASATVVSVPEPSTWVMGLAGLACGGYSLFRRRKQA